MRNLREDGERERENHDATLQSIALHHAIKFIVHRSIADE